MKVILSDRRQVMVLLAALVATIGPSGASADGLTHLARQSGEAQQLKIAMGKSAIIDLPVAIKRASLANPDIADAIVLSPKQIYVTGKGFGTTNLTLWGKDEQVFSIFDVEVGLDVSRLQTRIRALLPDEEQIGVTSTNDHVTLTGVVSNSNRLSQVTAIAEAYAPKKVLNFMKIHPEPKEETPASAVVEVIKGTSVNHVTPK
jgi:pilus assembly protein CpaC